VDGLFVASEVILSAKPLLTETASYIANEGLFVALLVFTTKTV
jgi:hypothetical protein